MAEEEGEQDHEEAPPAPPPKSPSLLRYLPLVLVILLMQAGAAYFVIDRFLFQTDDPDLVGLAEGERPRVIPESN